ncbi:MAG: DUF1801 domain-containing protein [Calditrichaeota bacterium]|nr:MAG: DUF1801 domain-containing protein [Calditrichota bacterium]
MTNHPDNPVHPEVAAVFATYPEPAKSKLLFLRQLIYETAVCLDEVGALEETLKWGEPSYLTPASKSGSTIRIAWKASKPDQYSIFFKCTANLVPAFKEKYPQTFRYGGNRSIDFTLDDQIPVRELKRCIALALTYHRNKNLTATTRWEMVKKII